MGSQKLELGDAVGAIDAVEFVVRPAGREWRSLVASRPPLTEQTRRFREQLGLAPDRPVLMAGHQPTIWHPGILAKMYAIATAARSLNAAAGWVVVDQDDVDPWALRYPVRSADGSLAARVWRMDGSTRPPEGRSPLVNLRPIASAATATATLEGSFATPGIESGLGHIAGAVTMHADAPSAAMQLARATRDLAGSPAREVVVFPATRISGTELFAQIVDALRREPASARRLYNAAAARHPSARIAPLAEGELPLWHFRRGSGESRKRVTIAALATAPIAELAPRALLMTGLLRWCGCDMFVHGTGGAGGEEEHGAGGYDAVTTEWFRDWMGVDLAPTALVTATLRLSLGGGGADLAPRTIAHARWLAHAARHRPALLHDAPGEAARAGAVATLTRLKHRRDAPSRQAKRDAFRALHDALAGARARHPDELQALDNAGAAAAARRREADLIADRTWAFPLYDSPQLQALADAVAAELG